MLASHSSERALRTVSASWVRQRLAHQPVAVPVRHVPVGGVAAVNRCDPMAPGLCARNPPIRIVVESREHIRGGLPCISLSGSQKNTGALGTSNPGSCRASQATVTPERFRHRPRDAGVSTAVGLRASGLENVRFRTAFGRIRYGRGRSSASEHVAVGAVWRIHRTVWRLAQPVTGPFRFRRGYPGLRDGDGAAPRAAGDGKSSPFVGTGTPRRHRHAVR